MRVISCLYLLLLRLINYSKSIDTITGKLLLTVVRVCSEQQRRTYVMYPVYMATYSDYDGHNQWSVAPSKAAWLNRIRRVPDRWLCLFM